MTQDRSTSPESLMEEVRSLGEPGGRVEVDCDLLYRLADRVEELTQERDDARKRATFNAKLAAAVSRDHRTT